MIVQRAVFNEAPGSPRPCRSVLPGMIELPPASQPVDISHDVHCYKCKGLASSRHRSYIPSSNNVERADMRKPGARVAGLVHAMRSPAARPGGHRPVPVTGGLFPLLVRCAAWVIRPAGEAHAEPA